MSLDDKRFRNKHSAKLTRKRKQEYLQLLEDKVAKLASDLTVAKKLKCTHDNFMSPGPVNSRSASVFADSFATLPQDMLSLREKTRCAVYQCITPVNLLFMRLAIHEQGIFGRVGDFDITGLNQSWIDEDVRITDRQAVVMRNWCDQLKVYGREVQSVIEVLGNCLQRLSDVAQSVSASARDTIGAEFREEAAMKIALWAINVSQNPSSEIV